MDDLRGLGPRARPVKIGRRSLAGPVAVTRRSGYIALCMLDRLFLPALAALAALMIGLALVWPQGLGDRSPGPFGHTPLQQTAAMQAAMKREADASNRRLARQRESAAALQAQPAAPAR
jgi:hypothetical protein